MGSRRKYITHHLGRLCYSLYLFSFINTHVRIIKVSDHLNDFWPVSNPMVYRVLCSY